MSQIRMMKPVMRAFLTVAIWCGAGAVQAQKPLTLQDAIAMSQSQGASAQVARSVRDGARFRNDAFNARLLPQLFVNGNAANLNHGINPVTQQDGSLTFTALGTQPAVGGVNADDTFSVGGAFPLPYSVGQGEVNTVDTGTFEVSGGVPTGIQFQTYQTITGTLEGGSYDCDLVASVTARYEGVATYYSGSPATAATSMFEK